MPIKRFADWLLRRGQLGDYMALLVGAFNPAAGAGLMCRDTVSVGWDGRLFDCDFNQQLGLPMARGGSGGGGDDGSGSGGGGDDGSGSSSGSGGGAAAGPTVFDIASLAELEGRAIAVGSHCFGCTAGAGSSCQGATA
jgi:hypothetical protein